MSNGAPKRLGLEFQLSSRVMQYFQSTFSNYFALLWYRTLTSLSYVSLFSMIHNLWTQTLLSYRYVQLFQTFSFRFDGQNFAAIHLSHFSHQHTHGLANYRGKALTTGCQSDDDCSTKTELLDMNTLQWQNGTDYPFSSSRIYRYSTASTTDAAYIIGGRYTQNVIAEYKDDQWRKLPPLQQGRQQHTSISFGSDTMIFGGSTSDYK